MSTLLTFFINTMALFPGALCGLVIQSSIKVERRKERAMIRELGLQTVLSNYDALRLPAIIRARGVFASVALWASILLAAAHYVVQYPPFKLLLILSTWALYPIGARAATCVATRSIQYEGFACVWKLFYAAFVLPRLSLYAMRLATQI
jgi:hypothetical protein